MDERHPLIGLLHVIILQIKTVQVQPSSACNWDCWFISPYVPQHFIAPKILALIMGMSSEDKTQSLNYVKDFTK